MATTAERMASGVGFGALAKAEELKKRLWFTVGALIIYRLGTSLPLPGIDPGALSFPPDASCDPSCAHRSPQTSCL